MKVGVLALQGAFREHKRMLEVCGCDVIEVRKEEELNQVQGLVIPGGESTTIGKLMVDFNLLDKIQAKINSGMPVFGTCAGLIVLAKDIPGSNQPRLGVMDIVAKRNAFGRQVDSFEADLRVPEIGAEPIKAVFIRAPYIEEAGPNVNVLSAIEGKIVLARQDNMLVCAFHPELTDDKRIHEYFISMI